MDTESDEFKAICKKLCHNLKSVKDSLNSFLEGSNRCVSLRISNKACTDGETVNLPADALLGDDRLSILGYSIHEIGHVLYSDFTGVTKILLGMRRRMGIYKYLERNPRFDGHAIPNAKTKTFTQALFNAVEDPRIENLMSQRVPSAHAILNYLHNITDNCEDGEVASIVKSMDLGRKISVYANLCCVKTCNYDEKKAYNLIQGALAEILATTLGKKDFAKLNKGIGKIIDRLNESVTQKVKEESANAFLIAIHNVIIGLLSCDAFCDYLMSDSEDKGASPATTTKQSSDASASANPSHQKGTPFGIEARLEQMRAESASLGRDALRQLNSQINSCQLDIIKFPSRVTKGQDKIAKAKRHLIYTRPQINTYMRDDWGHGPYCSKERWDEFASM